MVRNMYKCKYLKLPGNHFKSNDGKNRGDGIYGCGVRCDPKSNFISFKTARLKLKNSGAVLVAAIALGHTQF